ncbi:hypothetical protein CMO92_03775 [Candidatus Woesearchaeota archaeon]|nr:hypothetical protein [Candidatus Woesearchaeota archaeon]
MPRTIQEETIHLILDKETKISKKLPVFYNPVMKLNRDISVLLLSALNKESMNILLPLAASGIRGMRFLKELPPKSIKQIHFNDYIESYKQKLKKQLKKNNLEKNKKITISNKDANLFLLENRGADYIDIDPFGPPIAFLDTAIKALSRDGILAVTATDTGALAGTFPTTCKRKYWATPLRNELMHEIGLRILIRRVQLIGTAYDKALLPILSYAKDHYTRVFFLCKKGKQQCDTLISNHTTFQNAGPLWTGNLSDQKLLKKMCKIAKQNKEFLSLLLAESQINTIGFYDTHKIVKKEKLKDIPRTEEIFKALTQKKFKASRTHFSQYGIKTTASEKEFISLLKNLLKKKKI